MNNITILFLLALLHLKHFLADFPLQTPYMLGKGKDGNAWILPLTAHCFVHASLTALILIFFNPMMIWLSVWEFVAHFIIDRVKVTYRLPSGPWADQDRGKYLAKYYTAFGLDQLAHQLTYIAMALAVALIGG